mmetsp:Transcript_50405/g.151815  ORF Transcript_50405/g.151815 Transcript_50405/m.151815 type:complete len:203 (+) Transcript_50405:935-1543(+)
MRSFPPLSAHSVTNSLKSRSFWTRSSMRHSRASRAANLSSSDRNPYSAAFRVRRKSALSARREMRYSAREVNIRYGSFVPRVTRSSMRTPMYPSSLPKTKGDAGESPRRAANAARPAFAPAITPWAAASSYPVVPQICPARYSPPIDFVSRVCVSDCGLTKSYSTSYPGRTMSTFSNPFMVRMIFNCISSGYGPDIPLGYTM